MTLSIVQNDRRPEIGTRERLLCARLHNAWIAPFALALACAQHAHAAPTQPSAPPTPAATDASPVVASYDGGAIRTADVEDALSKKLPRTRAIAAQPEGRKQLLDELIAYELLVREAQRRGYATHPNVVQAVQHQLVEALTSKTLAVSPESIPQADVDAYYAANRERFHRAERRRARHVSFATEAEASATIKKLLAVGGSAPAELGKLARSEASDPDQRRQSGELGFFDATGKRREGEDTVPPELVKATFALHKDGEIAPKPIRTEHGFSVLVLVTIDPGIDASLRESSGEIRDILARERTLAAIEATVAQQRTEHPTQIHAERVEHIVLDPVPARGSPRGMPIPTDPRAPLKITEPDGF